MKRFLIATLVSNSAQVLKLREICSRWWQYIYMLKEFHSFCDFQIMMLKNFLYAIIFQKLFLFFLFSLHIHFMIKSLLQITLHLWSPFWWLTQFFSNLDTSATTSRSLDIHERIFISHMYTRVCYFTLFSAYGFHVMQGNLKSMMNNY